MTLLNGDYIAVEEKIVETILADTEEGGLVETGAPAVKTALAADEQMVENKGQADFPLIIIRAQAKTELPAVSSYSVNKTFLIKSLVFDRSMDRSQAQLNVRKISSALEKLFRRQTASDKQFMGLPDLIENSEGALVSTIKQTSMLLPAAKKDGVMAIAEVVSEILLPCSYRYE